MKVVHTNLAHKIHRGDGEMIVAEYQVGKSRVSIDTSYVCTTPEQREVVDRNIALAVWDIIEEIMERGEAV